MKIAFVSVSVIALIAILFIAYLIGQVLSLEHYVISLKKEVNEMWGALDEHTKMHGWIIAKQFLNKREIDQEIGEIKDKLQTNKDCEWHS